MKSRYKSCRYNGKRMRSHRAWLINVLGEGKDLTMYVVHHIDGDKMNNDPSNLTILFAHEHNSLHASMRKRNKKGMFI